MFTLKAQPLEDARPRPRRTESAPAHDALAVALLRAHKIDEAGREIDAALASTRTTRTRTSWPPSWLAGERPRRPGEAPARHQDGRRRRLHRRDGPRRARRGAARRGPRRAALEAAHRFDPTQADAVRGLYDLATTDKRDADALAALREVARLDQHERRAGTSCSGSSSRPSAGTRLAGSASRPSTSTCRAPTSTSATRARSRRREHERAAFELESALLCDAKPAEKAEAHALLARERLALGDAAGARAHRDEALASTRTTRPRAP